jgi:hypothetical protein
MFFDSLIQHSALHNRKFNEQSSKNTKSRAHIPAGLTDFSPSTVGAATN